MNNEYNNEYRFNIEEVEGTDKTSESYTGFSTDDMKPKKKHTALKAMAGIMALALVSFGSIEAYRAVEPSLTKGALTGIIAESDTTSAGSSIKADSMNIFATKPAGGTAMETEDIVDKLLPSVVGIESKFIVETSTGNSGGYFFGFDSIFGGSDPFSGGNSGSPQVEEVPATGTGVVITDDGYIVTNAHVIYDTEYSVGEATSVSVILSDDTKYDAEVVGYDVECDLAVLKIDAKDLTPAEFGDSDSLRLGESVVAIGNPLGFDLKNTVTGGMVSGLNRNISINDKTMTLIQTDAAINSGNSGGPLINKYGQVIGINSSKMSNSYSMNEASIEGIGFAIPSNIVSKVVDDIVELGYVEKPQLGISCRPVTEDIAEMYNMPVGVYVIEANEGGAAEKAGLKKGDIITAIDGTTVKTPDELTNEKNKHNPGDVVEITFVRNGEEQSVKLTLGKSEPKAQKTEEAEETEESERDERAEKFERIERPDRTDRSATID
ncbi:MAG: trypsin-like peptidase domain-containing protein [Ruminococcus sp.]|nr:trypsin-like peptidase domain-containing protein [Ruminococcus sp.]